MPKYLTLSSGNITVVDEDVYEWASRYRWQEHSGGYAFRCTTVEGKRGHIRLHRAIMQTPKGMDTDHIDHDRLNNLRSNLRICTHSENLQNMAGPNRDSRTGIRGVSILATGKYQAQICLNGERIYLGVFATLGNADAAAKQGRRRLMTHSPECKEVC